jgi:hypothetical protein
VAFKAFLLYIINQNRLNCKKISNSRKVFPCPFLGIWIPSFVGMTEGGSGSVDIRKGYNKRRKKFYKIFVAIRK